MMRWIHYILVCVLLGLCSLEVVAQSVSAREVMDRASSVFSKAGGIRAEFTVSMGPDALPSPGEIQLKGQKFVLQLGGMKTWFDGRTQWSYVPENEEVHISEPTAEELQGLNPYAWLTMYQQGGHLSIKSVSTQVYQVRITPALPNGTVRQMEVDLDKRTYFPLVVKIQYGIGDHEYTEIRLLNVKTGQRFDDRFFQFDARQYPDVEVIDFR